jgi:8-oxo-dGTP diphosphatase
MSEKLSKKPVPVVAAVLYRLGGTNSLKMDQVCVFQRGINEAGAGAWEFPGGKVERGESQKQALEREIMEELSIQIKVEDFIARNDHDYGGRVIGLDLYFASPQYGVFPEQWKLVDHDDHKWVTEEEIKHLKMAAADVPLIDLVFAKLREKRANS